MCPLVCILVHKARNFVAVRYGDIVLVSCYIFPNALFNNFKRFIDDLSLFMRPFHQNRIVICDDFNAKSPL